MSQDLLQNLYNACDPEEPASNAFYFDCSGGRGGGTLTPTFTKRLAQAGKVLEDGKIVSSQRCCFLFSGHVGCGKSSELRHLGEYLKRNKVENRRYFPIIVNFSEYMDDYDLAAPDSLLIILTEIAECLRETHNIRIEDGYFKTRFHELKSALLSDVEIAENVEFSLGFAKTKVQRLKYSPEARQKVRDALHEKTRTMADEMNTVFSEVRSKLRQIGWDDFVLIIDDLEKVQGFEGKPRGIESQKELFLENAPLLKKLQAHVVYTVPLTLVRTEGAQLVSRYSVEPFVLPMIKIFSRQSRETPYPYGVACLKEIVKRRVSGEPNFQLDQLFEPEAFEFLVKYSGGHVRELMRFIRNAITEADSAPITRKNARRALSGTIRLYSTSIPDTHWELLAQLDLSNNQKIQTDEAHTKMLADLTVMEYVNGGNDDEFFDDEPWYAVNPIVRELQSFKAAVEKLRNQTLTPAVLPIPQTPPPVPVNNP